MTEQLIENYDLERGLCNVSFASIETKKDILSKFMHGVGYFISIKEDVVQ